MPPPRSTDHDFDGSPECHPYESNERDEQLGHDDLDYSPTLRGLRAGLKVFGMRYTLVRQIGRGGMGVVWLARDANLDLDVALKFLPDAFVHDDESIADLKRETRKCRQLTHPNIVRVHDLVEGSDNNTAAIAMEYVEGKTLQAMKREQPWRCFSTTQITPWLQTMVQALSYAHESVRIVHRDLKPANLMLNNAGELKILDFGIAHSLSDTLSQMTQGGGGVTGGTLLYMSPQQLMGSPPSVTDDVYALGVTMYELLTGKPPFYSGSIEQQIERVVPPPMAQRLSEFGITGQSAIPLIWEQTVAACLEKEANKRPQSANEVWSMLQQTPPKPKTVVSPSNYVKPFPHRRPPSPPALRSIVRQPIVAKDTSRSRKSAAASVLNTKREQKAISPTLHKVLIITCILSVLAIGTALNWWYDDELQQARAAARELAASRATAKAQKNTNDAAERDSMRLASLKFAEEQKQAQIAAASAAAQKKQEADDALIVEKARLAREKVEAEDRKRVAMSVVAIGQATANTSARSSSDFNAGKIGDTRTIDLGSGVTLTLCYCPPGGFEMGSPPSETDRREDEEHTAVQITRSFWLAKTECTQTQWGRVVDTNPSHFKGGNLPVENVSWDEVQTFITKLNEENKLPLGWKFSLPSEAQWEYACRAGTKTAFSFGDLLTTQQANFDGTALSNAEKAGVSAGSTRAAGSYAANAWALQDMHGNVWEWCLDAWDGKTSPPGGKDPVGSNGENRVYRGGSGAYGVRLCRSAYRAGSASGLHYEFLGFRLAAIQVH